ncbi:MAG: hypothetical protein H7Z18_05720 [Methylophilaceae bacterium]|nr:hypothetical protein [Methylophilaceae bacterium]
MQAQQNNLKNIQAQHLINQQLVDEIYAPKTSNKIAKIVDAKIIAKKNIDSNSQKMMFLRSLEANCDCV